MAMEVVSLSLGLGLVVHGAWAQSVPVSASSSTAPSTGAVPMVEIMVVVKDRTTKTPVTARLFSTSVCPTYAENCRSFGAHSAKVSPSRQSCPQGYNIFAVTTDGRYYQESTSAGCDAPQAGDPPVELLFARWNDTAWLGKKADQLKDVKPGVATVIFAEVNQLQPSQVNLENTLRTAGKALNIDESEALFFDPQQGKKVASPKLGEAIKAFQRANKLTDDGILGPATMQKLAGDKPLPTLFKELATISPANDTNI
jgi:hypothetical protein